MRSKDGFSFSLDVSAIIHIGMKNAPRVISRVGSMQNLVDHVLQPVVGNHFRNSAQQVSVLGVPVGAHRSAARGVHPHQRGARRVRRRVHRRADRRHPGPGGPHEDPDRSQRSPTSCR
ncbi:MAG: hypothetical protein IPH44_28145 [Myxococcales bacterium]|nr:hypothetical protein [Myxococcales bacterium]